MVDVKVLLSSYSPKYFRGVAASLEQKFKRQNLFSFINTNLIVEFAKINKTG